MSINLKRKVYRKLLKEMAIITPKNFLEKIIKLFDDRPQIIGDPSITSVKQAFDKIDDNLFNKKKYLSQLQTNEFLNKLKDEYKEKEASRQKSVEIRKSKGIKVSEKDLKPITLSEEEKEYRLNLFEATAVKEKNIALEIIKIVNVTKLLELKGKQNKKKLKEAEEVLIQQIRKHKNFDGESIEFKKVLPMFDSIIKYIENSVDIDLDTCIRAADLYMRVYYDIARKEEKEEIDKGNFDFKIIVKRINFAKNYKKRELISDSMFDESLIKIYEDDDMLIVYPTSYKAFKHMINNVLQIKHISWCTYNGEATWINYNVNQYVAIAHSKKVEFGDQAYAISLKVRKDGSVDVPGTCDFNNDHVESDFLYRYITSNMEEEIAKLPTDVDLQTNFHEYEASVVGLCKLNDVEELKVLLGQSFAYTGTESSMDLFELMCTQPKFSKENSAEVIVDSISYYMFDNLNAETFYFSDFFNAVNTYPTIEIYDNLKNKVLNQRSHPRYLNALLELHKISSSTYSLKTLDFKEFKKALEIACNTSNTNNLKRILKLAIQSDEYKVFLNPYSIKNKKEGLSKRNIEIYDMLIDSQGIKSYITEFGVNSIDKISGSSSSGFTQGALKPDVFISNLIFRYQEAFINQLKEENVDSNEDPVTRVDLNLVTRYIIQDASSGSDFLNKSKEKRKFLSLDEDFYQEVKENVLSKYETFNLIKDYLKDNDAYILYRLIGYNMANGNPFNVQYDQEQFNIFNDLTTYRNIFNGADYYANFPLFLSLYKKNVLDLNTKTLENIAEFVRSMFSNNSEMAEQEACRNFFNTAILNSTTKDFDFKYTYEIFKLLTDRLKNNIIADSFYEISMSIVRDEQIRNKIKNICNKSKIFIESSSFIDSIDSNRIKFDHQGHAKVIFLILTRLDFVPIAKRKNYFIQFINGVFMSDKSNSKYYSTNAERKLLDAGIEKIDQQIVCSEETISAIRNFLMNVIRHYGKTELHTQFINAVIQIFTENNKPFPKDIMQAIAIKSSGQNYSSASGIKNFFKNFIGISEDGSSHLYGKELSIVRETLKELFRDRQFSSNKSMFGTRYSKEEAFKIVQKMGKHARMHMTMAFPDEATNLRANTPEEDAELQADSLIRQYVKMLLS